MQVVLREIETVERETKTAHIAGYKYQQLVDIKNLDFCHRFQIEFLELDDRISQHNWEKPFQQCVYVSKSRNLQAEPTNLGRINQ